jgi:hypothetical protein
MGLVADWGGGHPPSFDLQGRSIIDIGGGPCSLLLKCQNLGEAIVVDPAPFPPWVKARYKEHGVKLVRKEAENIGVTGPAERYDEAWIYNVLQHVRDPEQVVQRAMMSAKLVRIFEWVGIAAYDGHPNELEPEKLDEWLGSSGFVTHVNEAGAVGQAYYGVFSVRGA